MVAVDSKRLALAWNNLKEVIFTASKGLYISRSGIRSHYLVANPDVLNRFDGSVEHQDRMSSRVASRRQYHTRVIIPLAKMAIDGVNGLLLVVS